MSVRVAIIVPSLSGGGAERVVSNLSFNLNESFEIYLIVYDNYKIAYPYKGELLCTHTKAAAGIPGKAAIFFKRLYLIAKIKRKYGIKTAISFLKGPNIINILTKREEKVVVSVRNHLTKNLNGFYGRIYKLLIKALYNRADLIVAVSKAIRNDLVDNFNIQGNRIKVIYNPYDVKQITKLAAQAVEPEIEKLFSFPVIINVGRLKEQKGQWHLIRAFTRVKEAIPEAKLILVGRGELEDYLKQLVLQYGLQKDIYFLGFTANPFKYLSKSAIFVLSSLYEGFPNALAEAMACGLPVISTDCRSGPREILAPASNEEKETRDIEYGEYGILVPVFDGKKYGKEDCLTVEELMLAESIVKLYEDKSTYEQYRKLSLERIKDFELERIIPEYESIL